jgi:hypothetical protein
MMAGDYKLVICPAGLLVNGLKIQIAKRWLSCAGVYVSVLLDECASHFGTSTMVCCESPL